MFQKYKDRVAFYIVYIQEAHASDFWQMPDNIRQGVIFRNPATLLARQAVADSCVRKLHIAIPALLDGMDNRVEAEYKGWPDRLYLIDIQGRIVFRSKPGPFGFHSRDMQPLLDHLAGQNLSLRMRPVVLGHQVGQRELCVALRSGQAGVAE
jgi:hypothetical protein